MKNAKLIIDTAKNSKASMRKNHASGDFGMTYPKSGSALGTYDCLPRR
jgi:hypothetical protein